MTEQTDEKHGLTVNQIREKLAEHDIVARRQVMYEDLVALRDYGLDIRMTNGGRGARYWVANRKFKMAEMGIIVDAIQASKFITVQKSEDLIERIAGLLNNYDEDLIKRQVFVAGRIKNMNDSIFTSTDLLHRAIHEEKMIRFRYFSWNMDKEPELRHDGEYYEVSPWALFWDNENYYLVAFDSDAKKMKHYRVDKMLDVSITDKKRKGTRAYRELNKSSYAQKHFGMFGGKEMKVTLECHRDMANVIIDRFGRKIEITPVGKDRFRTEVDVVVSDQFLGWIVALSGDVRILSPESVVERMREMLSVNESLYSE